MIILPRSQIPAELASSSSDEIIKAMMKEIDETDIEKYN